LISSFKSIGLTLMGCMLLSSAAHAQSRNETAAEVAATEEGNRQALDEIASALAAMTDAWRRADFVGSNRWMSQTGWYTFNGKRQPMAEFLDRAKANPSFGFAGQWISDFDVRYDVLAPSVIVTTWENDFARIMPDGTRGPVENALMTLVWSKTPAGWRIVHYHESTRLKDAVQ